MGKLNWTLWDYFLAALGLGLLARFACAYFVFGAQSVDDYSHAVLPALESIAGLSLEIPVWRSPLLVWTLQGIVKSAHAVGIDSVFGVIRFMYFVLSLLGLVPLYLYFVQNKNSAIESTRLSPAFLLPLFFIAIHFLMPFAQTRAFGESIAMSLVLTSFLLMERNIAGNWRVFFAGALVLGIACLYRFQVGLLCIAWLAYLVGTRRWKETQLLVLAGALTAGAAAGIDLLYERWPLQTLYSYFLINQDGGVGHTSQPWYHTWFAALAVWFGPLSIPLWGKLRSCTRLEKLMLWMSGFFILMHSLIPHKEERFLYPVAPLLLLVLAGMWARSWGELYEKWIFRPAAGLVLSVGLILVCTSNSQGGEYEPLQIAERSTGPVLIWEVQSVLRESYFRDRLVYLMKGKVNLVGADAWPSSDEITQKQERYQTILFVTSEQPPLSSVEQIAFPPEWRCDPPKSVQSIGDGVIYRLNPKYNQRRKPTWVRLCQRS